MSLYVIYNYEEIIFSLTNSNIAEAIYSSLSVVFWQGRTMKKVG